MDEKIVRRQWKVIPSTFQLLSTARLMKPQEFQRQIQFQESRNNAIRTSKYTWVTFLPKNLFEQFYRLANFYFLCIIILNWVPAINAFGKEVAMIPLLFVLSVTAVKDLFEDSRRHRSDREINSRICRVYSRESSRYVNEKWKDIVVGDIIRLSSDDEVPADILLLNASDENGICYVSTASLDGETNLKQKQPVSFMENGKSHSEFQPTDAKFIVECESPNNQIHKFGGNIELMDGRKLHIDKNHLLLRGCRIKNTDVVEGLVVYTGHDTKAMLNNSGPRYKRSKLERDMNKDVLACVFILFVLCVAGGIGCGIWTRENLALNKILALTTRDPAMEGFIRVWTFVIVLQVIIPVSLYVSLELVKLGQVYFINQDMELFYEPAAKFSICRATTINEDLGQIQYVFSDKTGTLTENKMVLRRLTVLGSDCRIPEGSSEDALEEHCRRIPIEALRDDEHDVKKSWSEFFVAISICNTVVVVDSMKSVDSAGSKDNEGFDDSTLSAVDLGPLYDDADCSSSLGPKVANGGLNSPSNIEPSMSSEPYVMYKNRNVAGTSELPNHAMNGDMKRPNHDWKSNSVCKAKERTPKLKDLNERPTYEAESPDEEALVKGAYYFGYVLTGRFPGSVKLRLPNGRETNYELLHTLGFDSSRKRMSVIVRNRSGEIKLFCKGADTVIMSRLRSYSDPTIETVQSQIEEFAHEGLRTLCVAKRDLTEEEYGDWYMKYREAELSLENRDEKIEEVVDEIENNLVLLGATAVEDKLQDGVADTIASLREAGIKVWVLTGDKQETAINIAFSSKLLDEQMEILVINANSMEDCNDQLDSALQRLASLLPTYTFSPMRTTKNSSLALVINGPTLALALSNSLQQKFIDVAECCSAVLCCRAAPIQKASVVKLVRKTLKAMCLSIGDGANDVSMLQMADVGIGIVGNEGMQAAMASDFVLGRFKFLKRLLLLHGHWCYDRIARMIVYFFYKNAIFVFLLSWYQLFNGFSGSNAIDDYSLILFTLVFTSTPPVVSGILDQCTSAGQLLSKPHLYKRGQDSEAYTRKLFFVNLLDALYQSVILFAIPYYGYRETDIGMTSVGVLFHQIAVITVCFHLAIETPSWTLVHHLFLWGSIVLSYLWFLGLCAVFPLLNTYWVFYNEASRLEFWLLNVLAPVAALFPRYIIRCVQSIFFPTETYLSRIESLVSSRNSHHSLRRFGSDAFVQTMNYRQSSNEDVA